MLVFLPETDRCVIWGSSAACVHSCRPGRRGLWAVAPLLSPVGEESQRGALLAVSRAAPGAVVSPGGKRDVVQ